MAAAFEFTIFQSQRCPDRSGLVFKMAYAGKDHGNAVFVGGIDHFLVSNGAAGLDYRFDSIICGYEQAVWKGKERV